MKKELPPEVQEKLDEISEIFKDSFKSYIGETLNKEGLQRISEAAHKIIDEYTVTYRQRSGKLDWPILATVDEANQKINIQLPISLFVGSQAWQLRHLGYELKPEIPAAWALSSGSRPQGFTWLR